MERVTLARQYARALFEMAGRVETVDRVAAELEAVARRIDDEPELNRLLFHPELPIAEKLRFVQLLMPEGCSAETTAFLNLVAQRRHLRLLPEVISSYAALREASFGVLKAEIETAHPLAPELRDRIQEVLVKTTGHRVTISEKANPELLGVVRIRIGDRIIDASIAGRLEHLKQRLLSSGLPARATT
jgi:F-type H+-transporting ATPase subunit delta